MQPLELMACSECGKLIGRPSRPGTCRSCAGEEDLRPLWLHLPEEPEAPALEKPRLDGDLRDSLCQRCGKIGLVDRSGTCVKCKAELLEAFTAATEALAPLTQHKDLYERGRAVRMAFDAKRARTANHRTGGPLTLRVR